MISTDPGVDLFCCLVGWYTHCWKGYHNNHEQPWTTTPLIYLICLDSYSHVPGWIPWTWPNWLAKSSKVTFESVKCKLTSPNSLSWGMVDIFWNTTCWHSTIHGTIELVPMLGQDPARERAIWLIPPFGGLRCGSGLPLVMVMTNILLEKPPFLEESHVVHRTQWVIMGDLYPRNS